MPRKSADKNRLPGSPYSERIRARVWITGARQGYLGVGKVRLLEQIDQHGSISAAAKAMGMSYKRAWSLVEDMNALGKRPLVDKGAGGAGGGHASLTEDGHRAVAMYRALEDDLEQFLKKKSEDIVFE
ncbi:MAG: winged helix-turn-helix domain-containing protein [Halothiobacillaceae bacterium]